MLVSLGVTVAVPSSAQAAISYGSITACFKVPYTPSWGGPTTWSPYPLKPVIISYFDAPIGGVWQWRQASVRQLNAAGCLTERVQTGYYWRMEVNHNDYGWYVRGVSGFAAVTVAGGSYNLGIGYCQFYKV